MQLRSWFSVLARNHSAEATTMGVERSSVVAEYVRILEDQLARLGVPEPAVRRQIRYEGVQTDRRDGFSVYLCMEKWDHVAGPRLMLAQGFLEAGIRKAVEASWVSEVSFLRGVWLRTGAAAQAPQAASMLRELIQAAEESSREEAAGDARRPGVVAS